MKSTKFDLRHGDCLELMRDLPDASVDLILCDLPYGTTACKWDSVIPFEPLWANYWRVLRHNGAVVLTAGQPFTSALVMSQPLAFKYQWVWEKTRPSGFTQAKNKPLQSHEDICVFSKGVTLHASQTENRMPYYPQGVERIDRPMRNSASHMGAGGSDSSFSLRTNRSESYTQEFTNYPRSVIKIASEGKTVHPTQKPVALMEYLIRTYTDEGDTVLDNTMGSGTTGVACANTGRRFIGMEQDSNYFEIARERIALAFSAEAAPKPQPDLFAA